MYSVPRQFFSQAARSAALCLGTLAVLSLAGCGNNYRPVVSAINPVGPSTQPTVYATAIADPGNGNNGLVTVIDVFGDTIIANAAVAPAPSYLAVDPVGDAYVLHTDSSLIDTFSVAAGLMTNLVHQSSVSANANPSQVNPGSGSNPIFITEPGLNQVAVLGGGVPPTARQELSVPANPVYTVGVAGAPRAYTLSQGSAPGNSTGNGTATAIENGSNNVVSAYIPVGVNPIYGVMTSDARRAFVVNKGSGTVSIINVTGNSIDRTITVGSNPLWADIAGNINELAVLNAGNGNGGSLSIINIALCSQVALEGNQTCDTSDPTDSVNFGQVLGTVSTGPSTAVPVQVAVLQDKSKAYVANNDGTVSVIDMNSRVKTTTITLDAGSPATGTTPAVPAANLNWIQAVAGNPTGKVLVTASNKQVLYVIRTDTYQVSTTIPLQGNGVSVRVTQ